MRPRPALPAGGALTGASIHGRMAAVSLPCAMANEAAKTATRATAVSGESWAMFSTLNEE